MLLFEREWADQFGEYWEVSAHADNGIICSQKITKQQHGWPDRQNARIAVRQSILNLNLRAPDQ